MGRERGVNKERVGREESEWGVSEFGKRGSEWGERRVSEVR